VQSQGTGPGSILFRDFQALKTAIPAIDAIDFDDENNFDATTTIQFAVMLGNLGYHVMPDAFDNSGYWRSLVSQINTERPGTVDGVHLQAYAGGAGNNPCSGWNFGAVPVYAGLWDLNDTPSQVHSIMSNWHSQCSITGGFMWLYDDFVGNGLAAQYASAIHNAVGALTPTAIINAGGPAVGSFAADVDFSGGTTINHANVIDTSKVTNPAPTAVYQTARIGKFTYTIPGFAAGSSHTVRLHFAETFFATAGSRTFNVAINGTLVLTNFDIFKAAGGKNIANIQQFTENANSSGQYVITFTSVVNNSLISGIEIK
jgi:hypothetical protein